MNYRVEEKPEIFSSFYGSRYNLCKLMASPPLYFLILEESAIEIKVLNS